MVITTKLQTGTVAGEYSFVGDNIFVGDNNQISNRDLKLRFLSIRKVKTEEEKLKHTEKTEEEKVKQTHRFKDRIFVIQQK